MNEHWWHNIILGPWGKYWESFRCPSESADDIIFQFQIVHVHVIAHHLIYLGL